ncbi:MAG: family 10 glycosylhydrolase [Chloroflexi bacterium]|nr:family 10 glycosylhydrolase [Chloroflexota bacterium]
MSQMPPDWLRQRGRGIHMTIRDVDCADFDVEAMMRTYARWGVTFFSFFAAGYVTTYPTALPLQRMSPWLGGRDLAGDIIAEAHRHGIRAVPMIDLGQLPEPALAAHPEWAARNARGEAVRASAGALYRACPLGGYIRDYTREMVAELAGRYPLDGVKFGGGSYGFGTPICHCPACSAAYPRETGRPLPAAVDWSDANWCAYHRWKGQKTAETVRHLVGIVRELAPQAPVVGNAVCFGDPGWTLNSSLDIEELAEIEDIVQVEVQSRFRYAPAQDAGTWQYLRWPSETARYMTTVSDRPIWTVASYFLAWPWRRSAVPAAEQLVYLAQIAANGGSPMVNLSGGPPGVHEDARGFAAVQSLYGFMARHAPIYEDRSAANVAIVYSQRSLEHFGDRAMGQYVNNLRGYELALDEAHIPFDILSCRTLTPERLARYRVLILPGAMVLADDEAQALTRWVEQGGGLIVDEACGIRDEEGIRPVPALEALLGIRRAGLPFAAAGEGDELRQAYARIVQRHPALSSAADLTLLPLLGDLAPVEALADTLVPLRRAAPFAVFPEGWAYPTVEDPGEPVVVLREPAAGRTAFLATSLGRSFQMAHYPPLGELVADLVRWAGCDSLPLRVSAPPTLQVSLRRCSQGLAVHCVNLTGGERYMREIVPLHKVRLAVPAAAGAAVPRATQLATGAALPVAQGDGWFEVTLPELGAYDVVLFEGCA